MPVEASKIEIAELARELEERKNENRRPVLILGSRAGGLFRSQYFYEMMRRYSMRNFADLSPRERFSQCYDILDKEEMGRTDLRILITAALRDQNFAIADDCLAELVHQELFGLIFTNNVDDLLENAFAGSGMKEAHDFVVFFPERHSSGDIIHHEKLSACKLIKICGELQTLAYNIERHTFQPENNRNLKNLLVKMRAKEVLIVGIDPVWDEGIMSALPAQIKTIWFVNEDEGVANDIIKQYGQIDTIKYLTGSMGSYDKFFRLLYWYINQGMPHNQEVIQEIQHQLRVIQEELRSLGKNIAEIKRQVKRVTKSIEDRDRQEEL